jgi:hypothetical protein
MDNIQSNFAIRSSTGETVLALTSFVLGLSMDGPQPATAPAAELLPRRSLVYVDSAGQCHLATAAGAGKVASAFVKADFNIGQDVALFGAGGAIDGFTGLAPGATYFMSAKPGEITVSPPMPSDVGHVCLSVGTAVSATTILFMPGTAITM